MVFFIFHRMTYLVCLFHTIAQFVHRVHVFSMCLRAGELQSRCRINYQGTYVWTAGQRVNPNIKSHFVWKRTMYRGRICPMRYTKWDKGEPNWFDGAAGRESCINIWPNKGYTWNDQKCSNKFCFLCEYRPGNNCPS